MSSGPIVVASRGSALALAQTRQVIAQARKLFPSRQFQIKVVKTTGDRLQTPDLARLAQTSSKGLVALTLARNNTRKEQFFRNFDRFAFLRCGV